MSHRLFNPGFQPLRRLQPGQRVPPFQLQTIDGQVIDSSQLAGRRVILAFLGSPADPLGRRMLRRLQASNATLQLWGGSILAVAPMTVDLDQFPALPGDLSFPVGIDPNGMLHDEFGAVDWSGAPAPSLFLVDPSGTVIYRALAGLGESLPSTATLITLLQFDQLAPRSLTETRRPPVVGGRTPRVLEPGRPRSEGPTAARARRSVGSHRR